MSNIRTGPPTDAIADRIVLQSANTDRTKIAGGIPLLSPSASATMPTGPFSICLQHLGTLVAVNEFQFALCVSWITFLSTLPSRRMARSPVPYGVVTPVAGTISGLAGDLGLVAESYLIFPTPPRTAPTSPSTSPLKAIAYTEIPVAPFIDF